MRGLTVLTFLFAIISIVAATAPLLHLDSKDVVPGQYIVVLHTNATIQIRDHHVSLLSSRFNVDERILNVFHIGDFIGFSAVLSKANLDLELEEPSVSYIEADQRVTIADSTTTQTGVTWGIDRIDQRALPLDKNYKYWVSAGAGVYAYVIDTGILSTHNEFSGRVIVGYNAITGETNTDLNGHGTHVAGTIGGNVYGVAKKVTLVAVKVLDGAGSGTNTGVIAGVDWATSNHRSRTNPRSVANMSLGGGISTALDAAVQNSIAAGITFAVAAGNNGAAACNYSPARVANAITVGATTNVDARATYSNTGACVTLFAPGSSILSAWIGSNSATNTISGTSMASPHVAGAAAIYIGHLIADGATVPAPAGIKSYLAAQATKDVVTSPGTGSPNLLLYSPTA